MATMLSSLPTTTTVYRCESTRMGVAVTSWAPSGDWVATYLTVCCGADVKGVGDGAACRACYEPVSGLMGGAFDLPGWEALVGDLGCPCPAECATTAAWKVEEATCSA